MFKHLIKRLNSTPQARDNRPYAKELHTGSNSTTARCIGDCYDTKTMVAAAKSLSRAYQYLGADRTDSDYDIKRRVRKLISIHHPDKLDLAEPSKKSVARATEKVQKIIRAYDRVQRSRRSRDSSKY